MKVHDFQLLKIKNQFRGKPEEKEPKEIRGFDTETVAGRASLVTDSGGSHLKFPESTEDCLEFLCTRDNEPTVNGFWNIDYDLRAILKFCTKKQLENFYFFKGGEFGQYKIKWIPHKAFKVRSGKHYWNFYDFAQYYGYIRLEDAAPKFLKKEKMELDTKVWTEKEFEQKFETILPYALNDSVLCKGLGEYSQKAFATAGVSFNKPISNAYLSENYFRKNCYIPRLQDVPIKAVEYAFYCYRGGRFEALKRGHFDELHQHDIKSAYPFQTAGLLDCTKGIWKNATDFEHGRAYGFYHVRIKDNSEHIALTNDYREFERNNVSHYSRGEQTTFLTQAELEYFDSEGLGKFTVLGGVYFRPYAELHPFQIINKLYLERKKGEMQNYSFKVIMNSLYGKFFQLTQKENEWVTGNLFNPIYASVITSNTRLELLKKSRGHEDSVVMYLTDSILSEKKLCGESETLGDWNYEGKGEGVVLGTGVYSILGKQPKHRFRGFVKGKNLFEVLEENSRKKKVKVIQHRPQGIAESIFHTKKDFRDMNVFMDVPRVLNPNFDHKRKWSRPFSSLGDCLRSRADSVPLRLR